MSTESPLEAEADAIWRTPRNPRIEIERNDGTWYWDLRWNEPCANTMSKKSGTTCTRWGAKRAAERAWKGVLRRHADADAKIVYRPEPRHG